MRCVNVTILGDKDFVAKLGKKGTVSDISMYNFKDSKYAFTFVCPEKYPERIQPLCQSLNMADVALLVVSKLDKQLGETVVALDSAGVKNGFIVIQGNDVIPEQLAPLFKGTVIENYKFLGGTTGEMMETLSALLPEKNDLPAKVPIDHFFNVKGVGTVVLGVVKRGKINVHDEPIVYPIGKKIFVRSIQIHDADMEHGEVGDRVGLALKGIEADELDRGYVIAPEGTLRAGQDFKAQFKVSKYCRDGIKKGDRLMVSIGLQVKSASVSDIDRKELLKAGESGVVSIKTDAPTCFEKDEPMMIVRADAKDLRVVGGGRIL
ncbi:MAG: hypothetical protein PHH26_02820 [Candidatus Thermoplasmatota archaeon]|nr:hypothetical protein [Candidatus Thermoplasmatota archaeon]